MLAQLRSALTYANVMATVAVFVALGGTSYAVATGSIDSRELKNNSISSKDLRNNNVQSRDVRNGSLLAADFKAGQVPAGPRGAPGAAGATNVVVRRVSDTIGGGALRQTAPCNPGERAVGGGPRTDSGASTGDRVLESGPALANGAIPAEGQTPTAWTADVYLEAPPRTVVVEVICARP